MMMDDSPTFLEDQIQNKIMERLQNELALTYLISPASSVNVDNEMCSTAISEKLA